MRTSRVKGVIALEPGSGFVFPQGEVPAPMPSAAGPLAGEAVPMANFMRLTQVPIAVYYGDNIPTEPTDIAGRDNWRVRLAMARLWVDAVNRHGGDATLVHLPEHRHQGQHALSLLRSEQPAARTPHRDVPLEEASGLTGPLVGPPLPSGGWTNGSSPSG